MRIDSRREAADHLDRMEAEGVRFEPRLGDHATVWRRWGEAGSAVVLLNGGTGSWMHWVRNIPALEDRYRVFAADLPGMGDSGLPPITAPVEDLVRVSGTIIASGIEGLLGRSEPVHIVGFSFGSMVGAHAAARLGDQVATFTMAGASGLGLSFAGPGRLRKPQRGMSEEALQEVHRYNMTTLLFADPDNADELALEMQIRNAAKARIRSHTSAVTSILLEALPAIRARLGAIWGQPGPFSSRPRRTRGAAPAIRPRHLDPHHRGRRPLGPLRGGRTLQPLPAGAPRPAWGVPAPDTLPAGEACRPRYFGLTLDSKNGAFTISLFSCLMSQPASALAAMYACQSVSACMAARFFSRSAAFSYTQI